MFYLLSILPLCFIIAYFVAETLVYLTKKENEPEAIDDAIKMKFSKEDIINTKIGAERDLVCE